MTTTPQEDLRKAVLIILETDGPKTSGLGEAMSLWIQFGIELLNHRSNEFRAVNVWFISTEPYSNWPSYEPRGGHSSTNVQKYLCPNYANSSSPVVAQCLYLTEELLKETPKEVQLVYMDHITGLLPTIDAFGQQSASISVMINRLDSLKTSLGTKSNRGGSRLWSDPNADNKFSPGFTNVGSLCDSSPSLVFQPKDKLLVSGSPLTEPSLTTLNLIAWNALGLALACGSFTGILMSLSLSSVLALFKGMAKFFLWAIYLGLILCFGVLTIVFKCVSQILNKTLLRRFTNNTVGSRFKELATKLTKGLDTFLDDLRCTAFLSTTPDAHHLTQAKGLYLASYMDLLGFLQFKLNVETNQKDIELKQEERTRLDAVVTKSTSILAKEGQAISQFDQLRFRATHSVVVEMGNIDPTFLLNHDTLLEYPYTQFYHLRGTSTSPPPVLSFKSPKAKELYSQITRANVHSARTSRHSFTRFFFSMLFHAVELVVAAVVFYTFMRYWVDYTMPWFLGGTGVSFYREVVHGAYLKGRLQTVPGMWRINFFGMLIPLWLSMICILTLFYYFRCRYWASRQESNYRFTGERKRPYGTDMTTLCWTYIFSRVAFYAFLPFWFVLRFYRMLINYN